MATSAQITANLQNAQSSTGPRTSEGKSVSSQNALTYGLTSKQLVLSFEDPAAFTALHISLVDQFKPANAAECFQVQDATACSWRMMRIENARNGYIELEMGRPGATLSTVMLSDAVRRFDKYEASYRRAYESAWRKLAQLQRSRQRQEAADTAEATKPAPPAKFQNEPNPPAKTNVAGVVSRFADLLTPHHSAKMASQPLYSFTKRKP